MEIDLHEIGPDLYTPPVEIEMLTTGEGEFGCFRIYHQCPASELLNTPPPDHNGFAESGEIYYNHLENVASKFQISVTFVTDPSSLIDLLINATVSSPYSVVLLRNWPKVHGQGLAPDKEVTLHENFNTKDLQRVRLAQELRKLEAFELSLEDNGWKKDTINISVLVQEQDP